MPRIARKKAPDTVHHVMCRSISEIRLFRDESDKVKYLILLSLYCEKFQCSVLSYCLMDTHVHVQFDPRGADLSKFMHGVNLCYAQYYNKKYRRHGHVFQGRFLSKIIHEDQYNLVVSAYIHNNPKDIPGFTDCVHKYPFSSFGQYLGNDANGFKLADPGFILSQFSNDAKEAMMKYAEFVSCCSKVTQQKRFYELIDEFVKTDKFEYRSERFVLNRDFTPEEILKTVSESLDHNVPNFINIKYSRESSDSRALSVFLMRSLCDYSYKKICQVLGNITASQVAKLSTKGLRLIKDQPRYQKLYPNFSKESSRNK